MSEHDPDALFLAGAAQIAYESPEMIAAWAASNGLQAEVFEEPTTDTRGIVARDSQRIILAFRGTAGRTNWLTNTRLAQADHVHAGFAEALEKAWNPRIATLLANPGSRQILITGHSLGGALALLAARRIGKNVAKLVTFGQPRAVDQVAAQECQHTFGDRYLRVIHDKDVVPRVPAFTGGYRHCGGAVRIGGNDMPFPSRVETAEAAVRLIVGRDIAVPAAFEAVIPLLEQRVAHFASSAAEGGVDLGKQVINIFESLLPSPVTAFIDRWDDTLNKTARAQSTNGLEAPEILDDHKMLNYLAALKPADVSRSE